MCKASEGGEEGEGGGEGGGGLPMPRTGVEITEWRLEEVEAGGRMMDEEGAAGGAGED